MVNAFDNRRFRAPYGDSHSSVGPPVSTGTRHHPHHFESEAHGRVVRESIHAGVLPLKFAYAGSAARTHDTYARSDDYLTMLASARSEADALLAADVLVDDEPLAVVEIGPGNGARSSAFLAHLADRGHPCRRYLGVDFSATLLGLAGVALARAARTGPTIDVEVWDVEDQPSRCLERWRPPHGALVCCLLGQTLGNVETPHRVLANIRAGLRPGDVLLLSVLLGRPGASSSAVLAPYRSAVFRDAALEPLLAAGLPAPDLSLALRFADGRVTGEVVLDRPTVVGGVSLPSGHRIRCFQSRRFSHQDVIAAVRETGWCVRAVSVTPGDDQMIVTAYRE